MGQCLEILCIVKAVQERWGDGHQYLAGISRGRRYASYHAQDGPTTKSWPHKVPMVLRLVSVTFADRTDTIASPHVEVLEEHKQMRKKWGGGAVEGQGGGK